MFITKISKFLPQYKNIQKEGFLSCLEISNIQQFDMFKLEKDYLLTLILIKFGEKYPELIFKGGTCLNKIYFPYFRLSEDLDFVINFDGGSKARKTLLKKYENDFIEDLELLGIQINDGRTKFDSYKLAMFTFEYKSNIDNSLQTIKLDISLKNNLELSAVPGKIQSIYVDKILEENIFGEHYINCIDLKESTAEKLRAGLTRKEPAIRDFFDIWYIKNNSDFNFEDENFKKLVDIKLGEVGYKYTLDENYNPLLKQIETDLKPVLNKNFDFNFDEIFKFMSSFKV